MPVTTRRQSRGLLNPNVTGRRSEDSPTANFVREIEDDDDPVDGSFARLSASEDDEDYESMGDEHESAASEGESNHEEGDDAESDDDFEVRPIAAKRRKLERAGNASSSKSPAKTKRTGFSRRVRGRLQNMLSLPFDVLFLVFSELGPMDLVNLARTSKALRQVLMSRKSLSVWLVARRNAGITKVPDPPEDMSEPSWALLLLGPAVCSHCSAKNVHRVDFGLRRRLCVACKKRNLVLSTRFRYQCPDLKESVMSHLPYTNVGGWAYGRAASSRFYWKPDLYEMSKRIAELEEERDAGKPGAQQKLRSFRAEKIMEADSIVESSVEFEKWATEEARAQAQVAHEMRTQRRGALRDRILAAGYDEADINYIGMHAVPGVNIGKALTEGAWKRIKTKVEIKLNAARQARLSAERCRRETEYRTKAEQCYLDILRQILPIQRLYLPAVSQARELSCFRELLDPDRDVQPAEWEQAAERLPESLSEWMTERRERYTSVLPSHPSQTHDAQPKAMEIKLLSDPSIDPWRQEALAGFAGQLERATSVFRHRTTSAIVIGRYVCHAWKMVGELEYVERGATAAHALVQELQLDPATTTASTLEQMNRLFICTSCPTDSDQPFRSWRSCVEHFIECSETDHPSPQWRVVSPEEASEDVRFDVGFWFASWKDQWMCNHCSNTLSYVSQPFIWFSTEEDAVEHVQTEHNNANPVVNVDLFSYPSLPIAYVPRPFVTMPQ